MTPWQSLGFIPVLTLAGPTPTNISWNSEPLTVMKGTWASPAVALASKVFPVPGGPDNTAPWGIRGYLTINVNDLQTVLTLKLIFLAHTLTALLWTNGIPWGSWLPGPCTVEGSSGSWQTPKSPVWLLHSLQHPWIEPWCCLLWSLLWIHSYWRGSLAPCLHEIVPLVCAVLQKVRSQPEVMLGEHYIEMSCGERESSSIRLAWAHPICLKSHINT